MKLVDTLVPVDFRSSIRVPLRRFYLCTFIGCVGNGLTLPLFVIYVHNVRGFSTTSATLLLALSAVASLLCAPLWGTLTDRLEPSRHPSTTNFSPTVTTLSIPWPSGGLEVSQRDNLHWIRGDLFVNPVHRRRGYGSAMLSYLERTARSLERSSLLFWVVEENVQRNLLWPRPTSAHEALGATTAGGVVTWRKVLS